MVSHIFFFFFPANTSPSTTTREDYILRYSRISTARERQTVL
ncbi:BnaCnng42310D [Brassica napus]|uniref:BnaCnng42310D protein n=1 Tax=Brassica napus TaxID=3708 RepID=A0A078J8Z6_BRANA|nr:BnaCnng42310D [Brassica napus]